MIVSRKQTGTPLTRNFLVFSTKMGLFLAKNDDFERCFEGKMIALKTEVSISQMVTKSGQNSRIWV